MSINWSVQKIESDSDPKGAMSKKKTYINIYWERKVNITEEEYFESYFLRSFSDIEISITVAYTLEL